MKVLLVSVNASYMHTNLAIRCLKTYAEKYFLSDVVPEIILAEYTINQPVGEVLRSIGFSGADLVLFSTYIWNGEYVCKLIPEVKKILPKAGIGAGGPEFGYAAEKYLKALPALDFIMFGEGEKTFTQLLEVLYRGGGTGAGGSSGGEAFAVAGAATTDAATTAAGGFWYNLLSGHKGFYLRKSDAQLNTSVPDLNQKNDSIIFTGEQPLIQNLDDLPFTYPELLTDNYEPDHKIYYYESTRGCPYSCAYCLSSVDKRVRFKSLERTEKELQIFLDAKVKLVKFVDRTYNLQPERYIKIWQYILQHHNGKTMFHFEIEAEYLSEEALDFIQTVPAGVMQFEIGVQSSNKETLKAVNRSTNIEALERNIKRIPSTIHKHLDLIAGLPYEDMKSFGKSYDFVMSMKPDALQLGFLKVLNGTAMARYAAAHDWKWMETPVYETFSTPYMSFADIAFLKDVEVLTDAYWNKETFRKTMNYLFRKMSPWQFMCGMVEFGRSQGTFTQARKELYWFNLLYDFMKCETGTAAGETTLAGASSSINNNLDFDLLYDLLRYDFVRSGKKGNFPAWYEHRYNKDEHHALLAKNNLLASTRVGYSITEYEEFDYDVTSPEPELHKLFFPLLVRYE